MTTTLDINNGIGYSNLFESLKTSFWLKILWCIYTCTSNQRARVFSYFPILNDGKSVISDFIPTKDRRKKQLRSVKIKALLQIESKETSDDILYSRLPHVFITIGVRNWRWRSNLIQINLTFRLKRVIMLMKTERNKDTARMWSLKSQIMIGRKFNGQQVPVL